MTAEEFRKAIAAYGMSQAGVSRFLGIGRSINDYATGRARVPELIEIIFALMRHFDVSPADARRVAGLPPENYGERRRNRVYVGRKRKSSRSWRARLRNSASSSASASESTANAANAS